MNPEDSQDQPTATAAGTPGRAVVSRRKLILGSALGLAAVGGGVGAYLQGSDADPAPRPQADPVPDPAPSTAPDPNRERLGAMVAAPVDAQDVERWRADIDTLAAHQQNLVRTGVYAWKVAPEKDVWDAGMADFYREQFGYAQAAGLGVNLVLPGAPDWAQSYGFDDYLATCTWFWTKARESFGHQVDVWQPFNEADHAHYQSFTPADRSATYLSELARLLDVAKATLGQDGVPVTTNLTGWPMNDEREQEWYLVLDAIHKPLDVISIDLYPADNEDEIKRLAERMERVKKRYGKPIFVAEVGLQTTDGSWTEPEQQRYVSAAIAKLRAVDLWGVCLYELRDNQSQDGFGIKRADGTYKQGFADVMQALRPR